MRPFPLCLTGIKRFFYLECDQPYSKALCVLILLLSVSNMAASEAIDQEVLKAIHVITDQSVMQHAKILSSKKYRGREAGRTGSRHSSEYIVSQFKEIGLSPGGSAGTFYQNFKIQVGYRIASFFDLNILGIQIQELARKKDYAIIHLIDRTADINAPIVFAGYGITMKEDSFDEYAPIDVKNKAVLVFTGLPYTPSGTLFDGEKEPYDTLSYKAQNAANHGALCLLVADTPLGWRKGMASLPPLRKPDINTPLNSPIPVVHISRELSQRMLGLTETELKALAKDISREKRPESFLLRGKTMHLKANIKGNAWVGRNIIGVLKGSHPSLKKEAVVIGAHYDHLGIDGSDIYFGANDNASGVSALISIAAAFQKIPLKNRRTIIFAAFDAEEIGKRGSKHFVLNPPVPINRVVTMINFDMIGKNKPNDIFCVGSLSSNALHLTHQQMNRHIKLNLKHPESFRLGRSDHTAFYYSGIPILYFFGGLDKAYNTPSDTWEKLIPSKIRKVAQLAFLTAYSVSRSEQRPDFVKQTEPLSHMKR